jgi:MSHA biogenesis protein MshJ
MKQYWQRIAARIDDMNLRQRGMLFAMVSLVFVVLAYLSLIEPVLVKQKRLIDQANREQSQLTAVRAQIEGLLKEQKNDPKDPEQGALRELERRVAEIEKTLAQRKQAFIAPTRLPVLLRDLLGSGRPVKLEALRTVPAAPVDSGKALYRHGVELTLKGGYFDLLQYLVDLEKSPARLLWGPAELEVDQYPEVRLTLQIQTVTPQRGLGL